MFGQGQTTVSGLVHVQTGMALAVGDSTLFSHLFGTDRIAVPDQAYGTVALGLAPYSPTQPCVSRSCEGYAPEQLWYYDSSDSFLAQATFTSSINHEFDGPGYVLTPRVPTFAHHCLAHVLSVRNGPVDMGLQTEVWAGPLADSKWVIGLLNKDSSGTASIRLDFSQLEAPGVDQHSTFCVRDVWARKDVGQVTGFLQAVVASHDLNVYVLSPC